MMLVWIVLGLIGLTAVGLFWCAVRLHRIEQDYPWLHPPEEDQEDGP